MGGSYSHSPLAQYDVASIVSSTGLSASNVRQLHQRYCQLCLRAPATVAFSCRTASRRAETSVPPSAAEAIPELSSNPLAERIVAAMFPGSADTLTFPEFCSAVAVFRPATDSDSRLAKVQFVYRMLAIEGNEFLTAFELCSLLQMMLVGNRLPLEQVQSIACRALSEVDKDKHNRITNKEFLEAMEGLDVEQRCPFHSISASSRSALIPN
uniref:EF-hand domain-containing protein n=1 Tax=Macrostomum lignano TaxID=282301 RepID=A0A1I8FR70_9PLAT